jgi:hypothetical protein
MVHEMNGKLDPDDVALADGNAYFSDWLELKAYLEVVGETNDVRLSLLHVIRPLI